jgi:hypothetical protein
MSETLMSADNDMLTKPCTGLATAFADISVGPPVLFSSVRLLLLFTRRQSRFMYSQGYAGQEAGK